MGNIASSYFKNPNYTAISQSIIGFVLGILFAPYSYGFIAYLGFIIVFEIFTYAYTRGNPEYYGDLRSRLIVVVASLAGFILGRFLYSFGNVFV